MNSSRTIVVIILVFLFFTALMIKLVDIQIVKSDELKYYAQRQQTNIEKIEAERGLIYDRNNVLLVYNKNDYSFYIDLSMVSSKSKQKIAEKFSSIVGKNKKYYLDLMKGSDKTICLEKKLLSEKALLLLNYKIPGLFYREDPSRVYHYGDLASHILGFVDGDYKGVNGIESSFNEQLAGEDGTRLVERDAIGEMITVSEEETKPAVPGDNLVLTINKTYQKILEEELQKGLQEYLGNSAVGIIMNPNTGEILSLANMDDYDPNKYWNFSDDQRRDRAVTDTYEPGSTFKGITMSALLDQNLVKENEIVYAENGRYKFRNAFINDTHEHGWLTAKEVIEESSNIGMAKLSQRIDDDLFYKYIRAFGFGNYTSIDLPGEVRGILKKPGSWSKISKAFISFGYEIAVTPIQLITAYSAIINGGELYQPQIVKNAIAFDGSIVKQYTPRKIRTVISPETSAEMRKIFKGVVDNGTGSEAKLDFINVGGKTGTSQKLVNGSYSKTYYNSSFIGFFPVDNPKIICLVLVNSPEKGKYGGSVAAPIFKNVALRIIKTDEKSFQDKPDEPNKPETKVNFTNAGSDKELKIIPAKQGSNQTNKEDIISKKLMPDLTNYRLIDGMKLLSELGIKYKIKGSGYIVSQSVKPGEKIHKGLICNIDCMEKQIKGAAVY
ncbi:MAG TPA: penicillin-binding protein [Ignavibacteriaceae bacterium]|nr:penicillin-binding protein [Ignavibacteriaceae bacterium]